MLAGPVRTPDFIVIGSMKSATTTLHRQLDAQAGVFMSTPKEPNFFSDDQVYKRGEGWYTGLFCDAEPSDICGESSTHYTKLPDYPLTIERLKRSIAQPKLIYIMRHPVDRLVSHYIHQWSEGVISCDIDTAIDRFPELINYSCYGMQLAPYFEAFGQNCVLPLHFDDFLAQPGAALDQVARFLGRSGSFRWVEELAQENSTGHRHRKFVGYKLLIESKPMALLRRLFVPKSVRTIVRSKLAMRSQPKISSQQLERITAIFDEDLAVIGDWLGCAINCENFKSSFRLP